MQASADDVRLKAKGYLERAMKLDPNNFDAVYTMATILGQQQQYEAAVKLYVIFYFSFGDSDEYLLVLLTVMTATATSMNAFVVKQYLLHSTDLFSLEIC